MIGWRIFSFVILNPVKDLIRLVKRTKQNGYAGRTCISVDFAYIRFLSAIEMTKSLIFPPCYFVARHEREILYALQNGYAGRTCISADFAYIRSLSAIEMTKKFNPYCPTINTALLKSNFPFSQKLRKIGSSTK